jgi:TonB-dependent starch-binding outer membrane protein SusC
VPCDRGSVLFSQVAAFGSQSPSGAQVGDYEPSYVMTFGQQFTWKRFHVYGVFDWHRGGNVSDMTNLQFDANLMLADTALSAKRFAQWEAGSPYAYLESASFLKLREVSLSYDTPNQWWRWTGGLHVSGASIALAGRNLFSWYGKSYTGLDPEVTATGGVTPVRGGEIAPYPPAWSYFLVLNFHF